MKNKKTKILTTIFIITTVILVAEVSYFFYKKYEPKIYLNSTPSPTPEPAAIQPVNLELSNNFQRHLELLEKIDPNYISSKSEISVIKQGQVSKVEILDENTNLPYRFKLTLTHSNALKPLSISFPEEELTIISVYKLSKNQEKIPQKIQDIQVGNHITIQHLYQLNQAPNTPKKINITIQP